MKVATFLVVLVNVASVCALQIAPYKVYQVTNESTWGTQTRIYGGEKAEEGRFPFMIFALINLPMRMARCTASLIASKWVLLAAHCVSISYLRPENIILVGGKANLLEYIKARVQIHISSGVDEKALGVQERRARAFFIHPQYNTDSFYHDIALVQLDKSFSSPDIKPIPLSMDKMRKPRYCTILGWGITPEDSSNYQLNYVNNKEVRTTEIGCLYKYEGPFICLKPREAGLCSGDSGGPLVCDNKVWGVASHLVFSVSEECGNSLEEYYSEIYHDLDWINSYSGASPSAVNSLKHLFLLTGFWFFLRSSLDT